MILIVYKNSFMPKWLFAKASVPSVLQKKKKGSVSIRASNPKNLMYFIDVFILNFPSVSPAVSLSVLSAETGAVSLKVTALFGVRT